MREVHRIYEPSAVGFPDTHVGKRLKGYHHRHVEIIEAMRCGCFDASEAWIRWEIERRSLEPDVDLDS